MTIKTENVPYLYLEKLTEIRATEERLLDSPNPITRWELEELGKLHRKAANYREAIFGAWNRAERLPTKPFWKKLFRI